MVDVIFCPGMGNGHRNAEAPFGAEVSGEDSDEDIPLEGPKKKQAVKQIAAASRPKRKGKAADPPVAAPAVASGLPALFGGASKPAGKPPPKRGASSSSAMKTQMKPYMIDTYPAYPEWRLIQTVSTVPGRHTVDTACIVS